MVDVTFQRIRNNSLEGGDHSAVSQVVKWLVLGGCVLGLLIFSASIRGDILELQYQIQDLTEENEALVSASDVLRAEYNSIIAPQELAKASVDLGLISANSADVLIIDVQNLKTAKDQMAMSKTQNGVLRE